MIAATTIGCEASWTVAGGDIRALQFDVHGLQVTGNRISRLAADLGLGRPRFVGSRRWSMRPATGDAKAFDTFEVFRIVRKQDASVAQTGAGDEAIGHPDVLATRQE